MKTCSHCNEIKAVTEFNKDKTKKDGLTSTCRPCNSIRGKLWRTENKEYKAGCDKKYAEEHRDEKLAYLKEYYYSHPEKYKYKSYLTKSDEEIEKRRARARIERARARTKEYGFRAEEMANNPFLRKSSFLKRRYNKTTTRRRLRRWRNTNKDRANFLRSLEEYRSRLHEDQEDSLKWDQWREVLEFYNFRCYYCAMNGKKMEIDHFIPLSRGGNNTKTNVRPACRRCNAIKSDMLPEEFYTRYPVAREVSQLLDLEPSGLADDTTK